MQVTLFDRQYRDRIGENGKSFSDAEALLDEVADLARRQSPPYFVELVGPTGARLLIGLAPEWCVVQYTRADGTPPYLMARGQFADVGDDEFLIGDTPTPVARKYRIDWATTKRLIREFADSETTSEHVSWESI